MKNSSLISVVVPVHCEADSVESLVDEVSEEFRSLSCDHELIVVDDGSTDATWESLGRIASSCPTLRALKLSRRFGKEAALAAGIQISRGDAVIVMDGDLQHPPRLISSMIEAWQGGEIPVVEAVKEDRPADGFLARHTASLFYELISRLTGTDLRRSTDFKLLDRRVVERWQELGERNLFFRGMVSWLGFERVQIPFSVPARPAGRSSWSMLARLRLAVTAITSFSSFPLRLLTIAGCLFLGMSLILGIQTFGRWLAGEALSGFTTVILLNLIVGGAVIIALGVIGEYIARIYDEVKGRPRFVTADAIRGSDEPEDPVGFDRDTSHGMDGG